MIFSCFIVSKLFQNLLVFKRRTSCVSISRKIKFEAFFFQFRNRFLWKFFVHCEDMNLKSKLNSFANWITDIIDVLKLLFNSTICMSLKIEINLIFRL